MRARSPLVLPLVFSATLIGPSFAHADPSSATVGDFLRDVARISGLPASDAAAAASALEQAGVSLPPLAPAKPLTERDVVEIGRSLGLSLRTSRPEAPFGTAQVQGFLTAFSSALPRVGEPGAGTRSENDPPGPYPRPEGAADPATKGKGKKKGLPVSPSEPL